MLASVRPGDVVANRFRIEEIAGVGGMGTVYRASDLVAGGSVALKTLAGIGERDAARFAREAAVLAELVHPGIVRYIAHGMTAEHEHYIAMEWLEGETLHDRLVRGRIAIDEALGLGRAIAEALAAAHARGVIHRDIKPMNLFLRDRELAHVKILDFGIARHVHQAGFLTHTGTVIGTPGYMAPEQVRGETAIDARTDVFSLGCVLYRCLTGTAAFGGDQSLAVLAKILVEEVAPPSTLEPTIPPAVDAFVLAMLAKQPADRPANARVVADELARLADATMRDRAGTVERVAASSDTAYAATLSTGRSWGAVTVAEQRLVSIVLMIPATESTADEPARITAIASAYGGRLERIGDGSNLVLFGHADVAPDHAARAARCALALRDSFASATYVVASGRVALDKQPVGDVIDRAARAGGEPAPGQVIVDDATAHLLDERFVINERDDRRYLRGLRDASEPARTLLGRRSPLVGRDRELATLEALWAESADDGIAHAVLVTAPPGGGKSRVRHELVRRVLQRDEHAELLMGRGDSLRAGSPFSMIADAVRRAAGVREGDALPAQREALVARVGRHVAADDVERIAHMLGELAGVPFPTEASEALRAARSDPQAMGDLMKRAWVEWLDAECRHHPVLLVLEDLHWGDRPTIDLVDAALRELATQRFMVVALARPEIHDVFPKLWANRDLQELRLPQLARKAAERLVRDVLGAGVDQATIVRVVDRAAGNAFFLEELIRAVAEGRGESLPDSVLSMLQLRLDALGGELKRVLRAASVFGEVFWRGGVAALLGTDTRSELDALVERELIFIARQPQASRMPGETEYAFRHDLVREAAYATMSASDRTRAHRVAGEWLVAHGYGDAIALASHFSLGDEPQRAAELFARAAEQAIAANDAEAVFEHARRGLACNPTGDVASRLQCAIAEAHNWRGEHATAIDIALAARANVARGSRLFFYATDEAFYGAGRGGEIARAVGFVHDLTATVAEPGAEIAQLRSVARAAIVMLRFGPPGVGAALSMRAEELAQRVTLDPATEQRLRTIRALRARSEGDAVRAIAEHEAGMRTSELSHNLRELAFNHLSLGGVYGDLGAPELALPILEKGLELAERIGATTVTPLLTFACGLACLEMGNAAAAREWGERAVRLASGSDRAAEGIARWVIGRAAHAAGDLDTAERELGWCIDNLTGYGQFRGFAFATLVRVDLERGRVAAAREHAAQAIALMREDTGFEDGETLIRLSEIEALEACAEHAAARTATTVAIARLEQRAAKIQEPWRTRFLAKPDNRALLARRAP